MYIHAYVCGVRFLLSDRADKDAVRDPHFPLSLVSGGVVNSTVVPQVQAVFPHGALTKKIKVGLQVNMFRPRRGLQANGGLLKKITVNHVPKKKRFSLIW